MATPGKAIIFKARGLTDSLDGGNSEAGAMLALTNLMRDPSTPYVWTPRPAATQVTDFTGFSTPGVVSAALVVGTRVYGLIGSARNAGKDEPFCYDTATSAFVTVSNVTATNSPTTPATTGAWTPPTMTMVGARILVTHPGFAGGSGPYIGWFDLSSRTVTSLTATTVLNNATLTTLSSSPLAAGVQIGDAISGANIPASSYVVSLTATTITINNLCTAGGAGVGLTITGGTTAAPLWGAGNTNTTALPSVPTAVAQFNGRAWFACANNVYFSDVLFGCQVTAATQFLTIGDSTAITALAPFMLFTATSGGIVQALMVFKATLLCQITGDAAISGTLAQNTIPGMVGTTAPRSVVPTPLGIWFMANDGIRCVDLTGAVQAPVRDLRVPFIAAPVPSRVSAAYNSGVYRISLQSLVGSVTGATTNEYWFDLETKSWSGPHSFPHDLALPFSTSFILISSAASGKLWQSAVFPGPSDTFTENGTALTWAWQTASLPPLDGDLSTYNIGESLVDLGFFAAGTAITVNAVNTDAGVLATVTVSPPTATVTWGNFNWGAANWGGATYGLTSYSVNWPQPVVYKHAMLRVSGASYAGLKVGNFGLRLHALGYKNTSG